MDGKTIIAFLFCFGLFVFPFYGMAQCSPSYYKKLLREADQAAFGKNPDYELAINKLLSAKTCQPDSEAVINVKLVRVFDEVNRQRELAIVNEKKAREQTALAIQSEEETKRQRDSTVIERNNALRQRDSTIIERNKAEKRARENYANDIAFRSSIALTTGDRSAAFRLAQFAQYYLDEQNPNVTRSLMEALYYNDDPNHPPLPWAFNLEGHAGLVACVAFSPNGKWLASGSADQSVKIWDMENGKAIGVLYGHTGQVNQVAFSPNGKWLATASWDSTAKIWDIATEKVIFTLSGHTNFINSVAFSPNGKLLATGSKDGTVKIWDVETGNEMYQLNLGNTSVMCVAFSPDGEKIAIGACTEPIIIWQLKSGRKHIKLHNSFTFSYDAYCLAFSPNGKSLAVGFGSVLRGNGTAVIWDLKSKKESLVLSEYRKFVRAVAFSPDGYWLATGDFDNNAKIWDAETGLDLITFRGHTDHVIGVALSPDGTKLATAAGDELIKIWDLPIRNEGFKRLDISMWYQEAKNLLPDAHDVNLNRIKLKGGVNGIAVSPDGKKVAVASNRDSTATLWNLHSKNPGNDTLSMPWGVKQTSTELLPKKFTANFPRKDMPAPTETKWLLSVDFSPDNKWLITGSSDGTAKIWENAKGTMVGQTSKSSNYIYAVSFSSDSQRFATANTRGHTTTIWNWTTKDVDLTLKGHTDDVNCARFSPDGKWIATGSDDGTVILWSLLTGNSFDTLTHGKGYYTFQGDILATNLNNTVNNLTFSPDGKWLATGARDGFVRIWDLASGKISRTFNGCSAVFSPDNKWLAIGEANGSIVIWDIELEKEAIKIGGHLDKVCVLVFTQDGKRLVTGSDDKTVKIWDFTHDGWLNSFHNGRRYATLSSSQLETYNLGNLLDIYLESESRLLATQDTWQIAAFADLYAQKIEQTGFPQKSDYERALRLYQACLSHGVDDQYFCRRIDILNAIWTRKTDKK